MRELRKSKYTYIQESHEDLIRSEDRLISLWLFLIYLSVKRGDK